MKLMIGVANYGKLNIAMRERGTTLDQEFGERVPLPYDPLYKEDYSEWWGLNYDRDYDKHTRWIYTTEIRDEDDLARLVSLLGRFIISDFTNGWYKLLVYNDLLEIGI